jgi:hypothetical protein
MQRRPFSACLGIFVTPDVWMGVSALLKSQTGVIIMKLLLIVLLIPWTIPAVMAQNGPPPAWSPAKSIGMFAYPKNNQNPDQQLKDESDCYGSARQNTGVDPQTPPPQGPSAQQAQAAQQQAAQQAGSSVSKGGTVKGAAGGAAGGAAIGAIAGDAGQGAAIGATVGAVAGRRKQRMKEEQAKQQAAQQTAQGQQQSEAQAQAQYQAGISTFKRAFSACMDARGYSVQ